MIHNNPSVSFIIPAYNVDRYIERCIDSLLQQYLLNYEIIIINDGSTDRTKEIINKYQKKNNHIILIDQVNQGQGQARNVGIDLAQSKYIMFIDADDYIKEQSVYNLLKISEEKNLDLLYANYIKVDINDTEISKTKIEKIDRYTEKVITPSEFFKNHFGFLCYTPIFVYKKDFLNPLNIQFRKRIYLEDTEWLPQIISHASRISMIDFPFYYYVQTPTSSMRNINNEYKHLSDRIYVTKLLYSFRNKNTKNRDIYNWLQEMISINVIMICSTLSKKEFSIHKPSSIKELIGMDIFPLRILKMPYTYKLIAILINLNCNFTIKIITFLKKTKSVCNSLIK